MLSIVVDNLLESPARYTLDNLTLTKVLKYLGVMPLIFVMIAKVMVMVMAIVTVMVMVTATATEMTMVV